MPEKEQKIRTENPAASFSMKKISERIGRLMDFKMGLMGAIVLSGIVFGINYYGTHNWTGAITAALKQGAYTLLFGGIIMRSCESLAVKIDRKALALAASAIIPSAISILLTFGVHFMKGTPKPLESIVPTAIFVIPSTAVWGYLKRKKLRPEKS